MKEISAFIDHKKDKFSQLPFFEYLQDSSISPMQRLAFAPCLVPFVLSFGELNKDVFRHEPTNDPIQSIINKHTYEDDHHWVWFLEDLENLGLNQKVPFTQTLKFLWGEETHSSRRAAYELYHLAVNATPMEKLVVIESVEATGNCFLAISAKVIQELKLAGKPEKQPEYRFFGAGHLLVDTGHAYTSPKAKKIVESFEITEEFNQKSFDLVEHIFSVFTDFVNELLAYAKAHRFDQEADESIHQQRHPSFKPIGKYLLEAGLVNPKQLQDALSQQELTYMPIGQILSSQGYVNQETIEYLVEKVVTPDRKPSLFSEAQQKVLSEKPRLLV